MALDFLQRLGKRVILGDGAMGTMLYERGVYINRSFDGLNLSDIYLVKAIHRDYIAAGAEVIETNTYGANPIKLGKYGLAEQTYDINLAGAKAARRCADEASNVLVAGSIGPLGKPIAPIGAISSEEAKAVFKEQALGLVDGGVDLFMLETFVQLRELAAAIEAVRAVSALPIVAMMTISQTGKTAYGRTPDSIAAKLDALPVEVIGLNCSTGPNTILEGIKKMRMVTSKPLAAFPNAGEPQVVDGRLIYLSTPEYFAEYTKRMIQNGVSFIGGCCGTTPKHIKFMSAAIRALQPESVKKDFFVSTHKADLVKAPKVEVAPAGQRSKLGKLLEERAFPVSCELNPPRNPQVERIIKQVELLQKAGIDAVNIPDGPRASARMSPMVLAQIIQSRTGMDTILHYTCRDRNILGMQSDLLGAEAIGLDNLLMITGDPPKLGDYPMATAVFDVDAIGLLRIADNLNHSLDLAGNPIGSPTAFFLGAAFNPGAIDLELEIDRLHQKIAAGAEYILTQPVFDWEKLLTALDKSGGIKAALMVGILPLVSYQNAEFFHNEVPGMEVPEPIRKRMKYASDKGKEYAVSEGVSIAQEALSSVMKYVQGVYIMPPFGKVSLAVDTAAVLPGRKAMGEVNSE